MFAICLRRPSIPRDQWTTSLDTHLKWMEQQHKKGTILLSGPSPDRTLGIYLIKAEDRAEAEKVAASDPYTAAGHTTYELIEWNIHQVFGIGAFTEAGLRAAR